MTDISPFDPPVVDAATFRAERAREQLGRVVPAQFANAAPDLPVVAAWARDFVADPDAATSMLLYGPTGSGKTWQAYGALRFIVESVAARGHVMTWRATTQPSLSDALRPKPDDSHAYALDPLIDADLLLLDDLGAGKQTEWTTDALYRLVDTRWARQRPTIYTTNLPARGHTDSNGAYVPSLTEAVGDRIVSRLADSTRVALTGKDRRWTAA